MNGYSVVSIVTGITAGMIAALGATRVLHRFRAATRHALFKAAFPGIASVAAVVVMVLSPMRVVAQSPRPRFDVVSVRPCDPNAGAPAGGGRSGNPGQTSPGRFHLDCRSVLSLINMAYLGFADGRFNPPSVRPIFDLLAGPDWIRSEQFTIEATTADVTPLAVMQGPMLQAVLEDRFKLRMRREAREVPVFELVVAKGGSKLTPFKPGTCVPWDWNVFPQPPVESGQRRCGAGEEKDSDGNYVQTVEALTLEDWVAPFGNRFGDRPIVNRTGITGLQTFRFVRSGHSDDLAEFAAAIKNQLGLDLRPARGPREFLILDHVERPIPDRTFGLGRPRSLGSAAGR